MDIFNADSDATAFGDILHILNYLIRKKWYDVKMFRVIKKVFVVAMSFFSRDALKCVSMNNQECKVRSEIININSNEPSFYL